MVTARFEGKGPVWSGGLLAAWAADEPMAGRVQQTRMEKGQTAKRADGFPACPFPFAVCKYRCQSLIQTPMPNTDVLQRR